MMFLCNFWCSCVSSDVPVWFLMLLCEFWCFCVSSDAFVWVLMLLGVFWCSCVSYNVCVCVCMLNKKCCCVNKKRDSSSSSTLQLTSNINLERYPYQTIYLSVYLSIHIKLSIYQCIYLSIHPKYIKLHPSTTYRNSHIHIYICPVSVYIYFNLFPVSKFKSNLCISLSIYPCTLVSL